MTDDMTKEEALVKHIRFVLLRAKDKNLTMTALASEIEWALDNYIEHIQYGEVYNLPIKNILSNSIPLYSICNILIDLTRTTIDNINVTNKQYNYDNPL